MAEYEVEKIVDRKLVDGKFQYRVKWVGYSSDHDTWEPEANLGRCKQLVADYHRENNVTRFQSTEANQVTSSGIWEAEKILRKRRVKGKTQYLVKWRNLPEDQSTWEPAKNILPKTIVDKYNAEISGKRAIRKAHLSKSKRKARQNKERVPPKTDAVSRKRAKSTAKPITQIREIHPEILWAFKNPSLKFLVKWTYKEELDVMDASIMYLEYPLYALKYFESLMHWVNVD